MTPASIPLPTFPTPRALTRLVGVAAGGAAASAILLLLIGQVAQVAPAVAAAGLCLVASIVSIELIRLAASGGLQRVMLVAMASFPLRLALVAGGVAGLAVGMGLPLFSLSLWAMGWYLVLLGVEVAFVAGYLRSATGCDAVTPQGTARNV